MAPTATLLDYYVNENICCVGSQPSCCVPTPPPVPKPAVINPLQNMFSFIRFNAPKPRRWRNWY